MDEEDKKSNPLPTEEAEEFARNFYKSVYLNHLIETVSKNWDLLDTPDIKRLLESDKMPNFDKENVN